MAEIEGKGFASCLDERGHFLDPPGGSNDAPSLPEEPQGNLLTQPRRGSRDDCEGLHEREFSPLAASPSKRGKFRDGHELIPVALLKADGTGTELLGDLHVDRAAEVEGDQLQNVEGGNQEKYSEKKAGASTVVQARWGPSGSAAQKVWPPFPSASGQLPQDRPRSVWQRPGWKRRAAARGSWKVRCSEWENHASATWATTESKGP
jgi:hypothetical protein